MHTFDSSTGLQLTEKGYAMRPDRLYLYVDSTGAWRWRYASGNGRVLADGGQGYTKRVAAIRGAERVTGIQLPSLTASLASEDDTKEVWEVWR